MSERTWVSRRFERSYRGYELEVYETGSGENHIWVWTVSRGSLCIQVGNARKAWQAKLYARRAADALPKVTQVRR